MNPNDNNDIGIDIGTSWSQLSYFNANGGKNGITDDACNKFPSYIAFLRNGTVKVGVEARNCTAEGATIIYDVKTLLGKKYSDLDMNVIERLPFTVVNRDGIPKIKVDMDNPDEFLPEEIIAMYIKHALLKARNILRGQVRKAVVTVPSSFSPVSTNAIQKACSIAGLDVNFTLSEPNAAFMEYYGKNEEKFRTVKSTKVVIIDIGGGTTDITCATVSFNVNTEKRFSFKVEKKGGDANFGGNKLDELMEEMITNKLKESGLPDNYFNKKDTKLYKKRMFKLKKSSEEFKITLSREREVALELEEIIVDNGDDDLSNFLDEAPEIEISREEFEQEIRNKYLEKLKTTVTTYCKDFFRTADHVLLVGGTCYVPIIYNTLKSMFTKTGVVIPEKTDLVLDSVVARGAAFYAFNKSPMGLEVLERTTMFVGIEGEQGKFIPILPKDRIIREKGLSGEHTVIPYQSDQKTVEITIYLAENRDDFVEQKYLQDLVSVPVKTEGERFKIILTLNQSAMLSVNVIRENGEVVPFTCRLNMPERDKEELIKHISKYNFDNR